MKSSKSLITQHLATNLIIQAVGVTVIALPQISEYRALVENTVRLPTGTLWMPILGLLLAINLFSLSRLRKMVGDPLHHLVQQTKLGTATSAFLKKSHIAEEDYLKHFIEGQAMKFAEMEQEVQRMQTEVERIESISDISPKEFESLKFKLEEKESELGDLLDKLTEAQKEKARLKSNLDLTEKALHQSKREFEKFKYEANEKDPSSSTAQLSSDINEKVSTTLSLISNLSWRLAKSWADLPPSEIRNGLEEINRKSEKQLKELKDS